MTTDATSTAPVEGRGGIATRVAAMVVTALVYGALVYVSRFVPRVFGMQLTFPAAGISPPIGMWFTGWGALGAILGTIISQLPAGMNPLTWIPANLAQGIMVIAYPLFYKKDTVKTKSDWIRYIIVSVVATALTLIIVDWNIVLNGFVPNMGVALTALFPVQMLGNLIWVLILGPIVMNTVSPYIKKSGLKFNSMF